MTTTVKIEVQQVEPGKAVKISQSNGNADLVIGTANPREVTLYAGGGEDKGNEVTITEVPNVIPQAKK